MTIKIEKSGGKARFRANDQEFLVADDGNVGIGTDTPTAKLDVAGDARVARPASTSYSSSLSDVTPTGATVTISNPSTISNTFAGLTIASTNQNNLTGILSLGGISKAGRSEAEFVLGQRTSNGYRERLRVDVDGNVGIGTDNPAAKLDVAGGVRTGNQGIELGTVGQITPFDSGLKLNTAQGIRFTRNNKESMRINSSGYLKADPFGSYFNPTSGGSTAGESHHSFHASGGTNVVAYGNGNSTTSYISVLRDSSTGQHFIGIFGDLPTYRVFANGNVANTNNSYGAISDIKLKENIVDASPKLDDISAIRFVNYNLKSQPDTKQFGVIAQELEEIFPALVESTPDTEEVEVTTTDEEGNEVTTTETRETGEVTKSVKYSVLTLMAVKALQEANDKITALEERLAALEAGN